MEKWIGPYRSLPLYELVCMEHNGELIVDNRLSYHNELSLRKKEQISYWLRRGVYIGSVLLCPMSDFAKEAFALKEDDVSKCRYVMVGDTTIYREAASFLRGGLSSYCGKVISISDLSERRRIFMQEEIEVPITWVRPNDEDKHMRYPVVEWAN